MKLVSRIKKVQEDLSSLKEQCRKLLAAKQITAICIKGDGRCSLVLIPCFGTINQNLGGVGMVLDCCFNHLLKIPVQLRSQCGLGSDWLLDCQAKCSITMVGFVGVSFGFVVDGLREGGRQARRVVIVGDVACGSGREMAVVVAEGRENVAVGGGMGLSGR
ncbi:hypothetical protein Acr_20g0000790 [Actinidia rufa]|uniref:Uncharacterized protein n=1 Tax=Actinidia rufa TaxID=165716 RepID=A0A7J0GBY2_9ERIC|nr:hypothetical protein Acr_20g0000790 [Actinidia rufa]